MAIRNGTNGDDTISGTSAGDVIDAKGGDDLILAKSGNDTIDAGSGDDTVYAGSGNDSVNGGTGDDLIFGQSGDDNLAGGLGDDEIDGGAGADRIDGGRGDDFLTGGTGADTFVFSANFGDDVITDFKSNDRIDLTAFASITNTSQLDVSSVGGNVIVTVPGGGSIIVQGATASQVLNRIDVACLLRGTQVLTPAGEIAVEALAIGDEVLTIDGVAKRIKWIGNRAYSRTFVQASNKIAPVRIAAGALGNATPSRDLFVSPEHAVHVDGVLVPAALLIDGAAIRQVSDFDTVEYFHLEFETAEVIVTDGAATESYVDHGNRRMFANYDEYVSLYGEPAAGTDRGSRFDVVHGGPALAAIRDRLGLRTDVAA